VRRDSLPVEAETNKRLDSFREYSMPLPKILKPYKRPINHAYTRLRSMVGLGTLPDFIIIGTQKGGTTSLYKYLATHPQIMGAITRRKELQFFTSNYHQGIAWYKACFPSNAAQDWRSRRMGKAVFTGESSPLYIFHPDAPGRIAENLPDVKLIALLRNPVDRAISHYHHMVRIGRENLPLQEAFAQEERRLSGEFEKILADQNYPTNTYSTFSYLARGRYIEQVERYAAYFKKEQILLLSSERFFSNPQAEYDKVLTFLGVDAHQLLGTKTENKGSYKKDNLDMIKRELSIYFKPYNDRLYEYVGGDFGW
jgi:hypothetical protein